MKVRAKFNLHVGPRVFEIGKEYDVGIDRDIERYIRLGRLEVVEENKGKKRGK